MLFGILPCSAFVTCWNFEKSTPLAFKISWIMCGDSCSEGSGNRFEIVSNSMWVLLVGRETSLVCYMYTTVTI